MRLEAHHPVRRASTHLVQWMQSDDAGNGRRALNASLVPSATCTLTAFIPDLGNRPFRDKRDAEKGYRDSRLRLNAELRQTECWDGDAIRDPHRA